jgi:hypothetical protein
MSKEIDHFGQKINLGVFSFWGTKISIFNRFLKRFLKDL